MNMFWMVWAGVVTGILLLATTIEISGARNGFEGSNGIFLFASAALTLISSPIPFIVTWIRMDFLTALKVFLIGGLAFAAMFALAVKLTTVWGQAKKR